MVVIHLVRGFCTRHPHLLCIDHHNIITGIHVRRIFRLVLAAQPMGNLAGEAAQRLFRGVHHEPVAGHFFCFGTVGFHLEPPSGTAFSRARILINRLLHFKRQIKQFLARTGNLPYYRQGLNIPPAPLIRALRACARAPGNCTTASPAGAKSYAGTQRPAARQRRVQAGVSPRRVQA